jgi:hypothetical protein
VIRLFSISILLFSISIFAEEKLSLTPTEELPLETEKPIDIKDAETTPQDVELQDETPKNSEPKDNTENTDGKAEVETPLNDTSKAAEEIPSSASLEEELLLLEESDFLVANEEVVADSLAGQTTIVDSVTDEKTDSLSADSTDTTNSIVAHLDSNSIQIDSSAIVKTQIEVSKESKEDKKTADIEIAEVESIKSIDFERSLEDYRSPTKALFMSLAVPGLGQAYGKRFWKTGLFVALEVATIAGAVKFNNDGDDMKAEAHAYADANFDDSKMETFFIDLQDYGYARNPDIKTYDVDSYIYGSSYNTDQVIDSVDGVPVDTVAGTSALSKLMLDFSNGRYGSSVGVGTDWSSQGWSDATSYTAGVYPFYDTTNYQLDSRTELHLLDENGKQIYGASAMQSIYNDKIERSEKYYQYSGTFVAAIVVNHISSAVDAFFTAYKYNKKLLQAQEEGVVSETVLDHISIDNTTEISYDGNLNVGMGLSWNF